ncbi:bifunctional UDP-3-O-[3-hydroxymyristoyl] N-acetylglucosamine deacetylase/3-hydroxyacyl-ACP dehydratase [Phaeodactylibacter sp.]|jgi:UDP-3-O-[3-hydroxymyristoyl] N-acetylglucosamine deacetylase/3-hydroxyacyl-[acyl-carrier-protein] dehydratase|uniref:bifunctional UDP-3-O-[3-hydroxymyristoyl] N-acetylglucosamine deacetylase/3-hydroxyacyl-ACP dehydratase n=1 Tax=Phaeodactylibacter sp. TaxID=1940289 RepID=UPI0025CDC7C5|nr:bifunctional UDP-3-O-[3-hydroxymyristoyl] N-acetylglucosamine deacetylase/3-hydroxyacyl-ACP dehydratase [Phaeodactylibacter sp.]MCI4650985.1 bifunctional UDP-3-O-[3-hydroxymyristoyl] N-acetylglucosamine deacetylase/3-hydroxyacyl-ACP dehydratase [Phaeodactylibacter sp.]MCI5091988.1 bifunctional UDP-3-O-[3-hydroxymyristoyl] N-acetylglucosamine deacetylase/3-hydroxyacyl-ACP dehydratase [Phaeodactylibacter sp.]
MEQQHTIKNPVSVEGVGLHTGKTVKLTFHPAPVDHGYKFQRIDLENEPVLSADINRVVSTQRGTTIKVGQAEVHTVEHVLSALSGLGIDNVLIQLDGPEVPILDGSAGPFVKALQETGIEAQDKAREYFVVEEPIFYKDEATGSELVALPHDDFEVVAMIDFNSNVLGQQYAHLNGTTDYAREIAPCRTFVFLHELEFLFEQNLIKGGDLDNAIVIVDRKVEQDELDRLAEKLGKPSVTVDYDDGILNTLKLQFKNEPARHKLLDVVGDISLLGMPIKGKILATKPGHTPNIEFTKVLKKVLVEKRKLKGKPNYDPDAEPLFDSVKIAAWLPHRFPFLLVDKIIELSDTHVVGVKNITFNEGFFQGHFPNNPVMPGVLQIEAMAQTGGILALSTVDEPGNWDTYFLKIENAKFKNKVVPGDTVLFKMELMAPIRRGICQMQATAYVGNKIVSEAELTAQIVKRS